MAKQIKTYRVPASVTTHFRVEVQATSKLVAYNEAKALVESTLPKQMAGVAAGHGHKAISSTTFTLKSDIQIIKP